ncbi:T9SS type A sorting domain-containing protein [Nonlabens sp. Asnod3-A02]|uniref:T9SS type A sorting domain-containing protein n=1 Tax=Nonlabens sp. Asnod3-A02 TaxID=3160579 RepID=UPI00386D1AEC
MKYFIALLVLTIGSFTAAQLGTDAPWMQDLMLRKNGSQPTYQEIKAAGDAYWSVHDKDAKGSGYKPFMRWLNKSEAFVKADGTLQSPIDLQNEINKNILKNSLVDNSNWVPAGPFTYTEAGSWSPGQGRVNTVAVDPNNPDVYYLGSPGGGAWKSVDAGATWNPITDFLTEIGASAIAIDPNNSNIVYVGTGDDDGGDTESIGLLKSTDAGATFNPTDLVFTRGGNISEVYIDPTNSNTIYVSSSNGFYKSTDAGANFTRTLNENVKDIKLKPGSPDTIYLSTTSSFHKSINGGDTWTQITSGLPFNQGRSVIGVTQANPNYVYLLIIDNNADLVGVYRSGNSGSSFTKRDTSNIDILENNQGWYDLALEVSPTNAETIYTGCLNVWKSTSGGSSFFKVNSWNNSAQASYTHADIHQIRQFNNELFVLSDGGIYRSTNDGGSFSDLTSGAQIGQFYRVAVGNQSSADIAGGLQDNGGFTRSANAWTNYYGADGMEAGIDPNNPQIRYGFTQRGGGLYISTNGGASLTTSVNGPEQGNWITPLKTDSRGTIYAGYSSLYKVSGGAFTAVSPSFGSNIDVLEIDPNNDNNIFVGIDQNLYLSTTAGATFTLVSSFNNNITAIEVNANDSSIVYAATSFSNGGVFKSNNQGRTFIDITGNLPNLGKNTLAHQGSSIDEPLYVGTTVGVYKYDESLGTWEIYSNNLPNVNIRDLEINTNDNTLTAATYGRGIWQSSVQQAAPNSDIQLVEIQNNGGDISCGIDDLMVVVKNTGLNDINSVDISYIIDRGTTVSQQMTVSIAPQGQTSIALSGINLSPGTHAINITVNTPNDFFINNNNQSIEILSNSSGVINDLHQFENREFLVSNSGSASSLWERGSANGTILGSATAGSSNVYGTNLSGQYGNNSTSYLYSGCYDLTGIQNPVLSFDLAYDLENNWDLLYMEYSTDSGNNWNTLGTASSPNWYNSSRFPDGNDCFNCVGAQWTGSSATLNNYDISLNFLRRFPQVVFRYVLRTDQSVTGEGAVIDNFVINGILSNDATSIEDMFSIYPNPSSGMFNINWNDAQDFDYDVYDVSGKRITARKNNTGTSHNVDLSGVAIGMYFIKITTTSGSVTKKLIVK